MGKMSDIDIELKDLGMINPTQTVLIPLEEYKELLIIKGKYEELKAYAMPHIYPTRISYNGKTIGESESPYTFTCGEYMKDATNMTLSDIEKEFGSKVYVSSVKGIKSNE